MWKTWVFIQWFAFMNTRHPGPLTTFTSPRCAHCHTVHMSTLSNIYVEKLGLQEHTMLCLYEYILCLEIVLNGQPIPYFEAIAVTNKTRSLRWQSYITKTREKNVYFSLR